MFTVEYSLSAAQVAVYELLDVGRPVPPVTRHDHSVVARAEAVVKALE